MKDFKIEDGVLKRYAGSDNKLTIPNSVTAIDDGVFRGCSSLVELTIPNSVTSIGASAFEGCTHLKLIKAPSHLKDYFEPMNLSCTIEYYDNPIPLAEGNKPTNSSATSYAAKTSINW